MPAIRVGRLHLSRYVVAIVAVVMVVLLSAPIGHARFDESEMNFGPLALEPDRGYFSQFSWENIDLVNGNLLLTIPILDLPGDAGMDLKVDCSYNWGQITPWKCGTPGIPIGLGGADGNIYHLDPDTGIEEILRPGVVTYDGGEHTLWGTSETFVSGEFWRYTVSTRTLELPNGWVATYDMTPGPYDTRMIQEIHDSFGNRLTYHWESLGTGLLFKRLLSVDQTVGGSTRTVAFGYDGLRVNAITLQNGVAGGGDRTWWLQWGAQGLSAIDLPSGKSWHFAYTYAQYWQPNSVQVTVPNGGTVTYGFDTIQFWGNDYPGLILKSRTTAGPWVTPGTWTFNYDHPAFQQFVTATVDLPGGRHLYVRQIPAAGNGARGPAWLMVQKILSSDSEGELARVDQVYDYVVDLALQMLTSRTISQGGQAFSTVFEYHDASEHEADYLVPYRTTETGPTGLQRVATRQFNYDITPYKHGVVSSETVVIGGDTISKTYSYDTATAFMTQQTVAGVPTTFAPDARGNPGTRTDALGHSTIVAYEWGVESTTQTPEYTIARTINLDGTVASETRGGNTTSYGYDAAGRPTTVTPPLGAPSVTSYYLATDVQVVRLVRGDATTYEYLDGFGRMRLKITEPDVYIQTWYDAEGRKVFSGYPYLSSSSNVGDSLTYDGLNRVKTITHPDQTSIQYTYSGLDTAVTDENGHTSTQHYVAFGSPSDTRLASVTDAAGQNWTYSYNGFGSLTRVQSPVGPDRTWTYDSHNWLVSETQPESGTTTYDLYDAVGNLKQKTDARGQVFSYAYDNNHRLTKIDVPGADDDVDIQYDHSDNRISMVSNLVQTAFTYDAASRLTSRRDDQAGHVWTSRYVYDDRDRLLQTEYPSGRVVDYAYDSLGRITTVTGTGGVTYASNVTYHPSGSVASLTFGNGQVQTISYDSRYRPENWVSGPLSLTYSYDPVGNVTGVQDARSAQSSTFAYDALDRLTDVWGFGARTFSYDVLGNRTASGTASYTYDANTRRLMSVTGGGVEAGSYTYDSAGNQTSDPSGSYLYTQFNMLYAATPITGSWGTDTTFYTYDGDNQRIRRANNTLTRQQWTIYDTAGRLLSEFEAGGVDLFGLVGTWHSSGAGSVPRTISVSGNQLVTSAAPGYSLVNHPGTPNTIDFGVGPHWATVTSPNRLDWEDGDIWEREPRDIDIFGLVGRWRASNGQALVVSVVNGQLRSSNCVYAWINHAWDPAHPEIAQHVEVGAYTGYIYSLNQINWSDGDVWTRDDGAVWTRDSIYLGSKLLATVAPTVSGTSIEYAHTDSLGSIRATTDQSGAVLARHDYGAFGEDMGPGPATGPERQRFTGKERDSETFFDYYGARYYRNVIARFTTVDGSFGPKGPLPYADLTNPQSINLYSYAFNNPLRFTDPDGHCPACIQLVQRYGPAAYEKASVVTAYIVTAVALAIDNRQEILQGIKEFADGAGSVRRSEELGTARDSTSFAKETNAEINERKFTEREQAIKDGKVDNRKGQYVKGDAIDSSDSIGHAKKVETNAGRPTSINSTGKTDQRLNKALKDVKKNPDGGQ